MKHTPEPWYVTDCIDPRLVLYHPTLNGSPNPLTETIVSAYCDIGGKARANLKRAAECVNALSGLNPAGVKGMMEAVQALVSDVDPVLLTSGCRTGASTVKDEDVATLLSDRDRLRDELERAKAWERVLVELFTRADSLALTAYIEQQSEDEETSEMYDKLAREVSLEALNIIREYVRKSRTSPDAGQGER